MLRYMFAMLGLVALGACIPEEPPRVEPSCDPIDPAAACGPQRNCTIYRVSPESELRFHCVATGTTVGPTVCEPGPPPNPCAPGYDCIFFEQNATTACVKYCRVGRREDCAPDAECIPTGGQLLVDGVEYGACSTPCDPAEKRARCAAGARCHVDTLSAKAITYTMCVATKLRPTGGACTTASECEPGFFCESRACFRWCRLEDPEACPSGTTCETSTSYRIAGEVYGSCR